MSLDNSEYLILAALEREIEHIRLQNNETELGSVIAYMQSRIDDFKRRLNEDETVIKD